MYFGTGLTAAIVYGALVLFAVYVGWGWISWCRKTPWVPKPKWRTIVATVAFLAGTTSFGLIVGLVVYSTLSGGLRFYDPVLVSFVRWGAMLSFLGLCLTLAGKGGLRIHALVGNLSTLAIWFAVGGLQ